MGEVTFVVKEEMNSQWAKTDLRDLVWDQDEVESLYEKLEKIGELPSQFQKARVVPPPIPSVFSYSKPSAESLQTHINSVLNRREGKPETPFSISVQKQIVIAQRIFLALAKHKPKPGLGGEARNRKKPTESTKSQISPLVDISVRAGLRLLFVLLRECWELEGGKDADICREFLQNVSGLLGELPALSLYDAKMDKLSMDSLNNVDDFLKQVASPQSKINQSDKYSALSLLGTICAHRGHLSGVLSFVQYLQQFPPDEIVPKGVVKTILTQIRAYRTRITPDRSQSPFQARRLTGSASLNEVQQFIDSQRKSLESDDSSNVTTMNQIRLLLIGELYQLSDLFLPTADDVLTIDQQSEVYIWGCGMNGKLGNTPMPPNGRLDTPILAGDLTALNPKLVLPGVLMTCVLASDGSVYSCGRGEYGRLGIGSLSETSVLTQVPFNGIPIVKLSVSTGSYGHGMAIDENQRVWSWGDGDYGKLGHGNTDQYLRPKLIASLSTVSVVKVSCGPKHSALISSDGEVFTFGLGDGGRLGHGNSETCCDPKRVIALEDIPMGDIVCGDTHTIACTSDGVSVWVWGDGSSGRLGLGSSTQIAPLPEVLNEIQGVSVLKLVAGEGYSAVLTSTGKIFVWGSKMSPDGSADQWTPRPVGGEIANYSISDLAGGKSHLIALTNRGEVFAWGANDSYQCGNRGEARIVSPQRIPSLNGKNVHQIAAGSSHSVAWTSLPQDQGVRPVFSAPFTVDLTRSTFELLHKFLEGSKGKANTFVETSPQEDYFIIACLNILRANLFHLHGTMKNPLEVGLGSNESWLPFFRNLLLELVQCPKSHLQMIARQTFQVDWPILLPLAEERRDMLCQLLPKTLKDREEFTPAKRFMVNLLVNTLIHDPEFSLFMGIFPSQQKSRSEFENKNLSELILTLLDTFEYDTINMLEAISINRDEGKRTSPVPQSRSSPFFLNLKSSSKSIDVSSPLEEEEELRSDPSSSQTPKHQLPLEGALLMLSHFQKYLFSLFCDPEARQSRFSPSGAESKGKSSAGNESQKAPPAMMEEYWISSEKTLQMYIINLISHCNSILRAVFTLIRKEQSKQSDADWLANSESDDFPLKLHSALKQTALYTLLPEFLLAGLSMNSNDSIPQDAIRSLVDLIHLLDEFNRLFPDEIRDDEAQELIWPPKSRGSKYDEETEEEEEELFSGSSLKGSKRGQRNWLLQIERLMATFLGNHCRKNLLGIAPSKEEQIASKWISNSILSGGLIQVLGGSYRPPPHHEEVLRDLYTGKSTPFVDELINRMNRYAREKLWLVGDDDSDPHLLRTLKAILACLLKHHGCIPSTITWKKSQKPSEKVASLFQAVFNVRDQLYSQVADCEDKSEAFKELCAPILTKCKFLLEEILPATPPEELYDSQDDGIPSLNKSRGGGEGCDSPKIDLRSSAGVLMINQGQELQHSASAHEPESVRSPSMRKASSYYSGQQNVNREGFATVVSTFRRFCLLHEEQEAAIAFVTDRSIDLQQLRLAMKHQQTRAECRLSALKGILNLLGNSSLIPSVRLQILLGCFDLLFRFRGVSHYTDNIQASNRTIQLEIQTLFHQLYRYLVSLMSDTLLVQNLKKQASSPVIMDLTGAFSSHQFDQEIWLIHVILQALTTRFQAVDVASLVACGTIPVIRYLLSAGNQDQLGTLVQETWVLLQSMLATIGIHAADVGFKVLSPVESLLRNLLEEYRETESPHLGDLLCFLRQISVSKMIVERFGMPLWTSLLTSIVHTGSLRDRIMALRLLEIVLSSWKQSDSTSRIQTTLRELIRILALDISFPKIRESSLPVTANCSAVFDKEDCKLVAIEDDGLAFTQTGSASIADPGYVFCPIPITEGIHRWVFQIQRDAFEDETICIGVARKPLSSVSFENGPDLWLLRGYNGKLYHLGELNRHYEGFSIQDQVGIEVDMNNKTVTYYKNGRSLGVAFEIQAESVYPIILFYGGSTRVRVTIVSDECLVSSSAAGDITHQEIDCLCAPSHVSFCEEIVSLLRKLHSHSSSWARFINQFIVTEFRTLRQSYAEFSDDHRLIESLPAMISMKKETPAMKLLALFALIGGVDNGFRPGGRILHDSYGIGTAVAFNLRNQGIMVHYEHPSSKIRLEIATKDISPYPTDPFEVNKLRLSRAEITAMVEFLEPIENPVSIQKNFVKTSALKSLIVLIGERENLNQLLTPRPGAEDPQFLKKLLRLAIASSNLKPLLRITDLERIFLLLFKDVLGTSVLQSPLLQPGTGATPALELESDILSLDDTEFLLDSRQNARPRSNSLAGQPLPPPRVDSRRQSQPLAQFPIREEKSSSASSSDMKGKFSDYFIDNASDHSEESMMMEMLKNDEMDFRTPENLEKIKLMMKSYSINPLTSIIEGSFQSSDDSSDDSNQQESSLCTPLSYSSFREFSQFVLRQPQDAKLQVLYYLSRSLQIQYAREALVKIFSGLKPHTGSPSLIQIPDSDEELILGMSSLVRLVASGRAGLNAFRQLDATVHALSECSQPLSELLMRQCVLGLYHSTLDPLHFTRKIDSDLSVLKTPHFYQSKALLQAVLLDHQMKSRPSIKSRSIGEWKLQFSSALAACSVASSLPERLRAWSTAKLASILIGCMDSSLTSESSLPEFYHEWREDPCMKQLLEMLPSLMETQYQYESSNISQRILYSVYLQSLMTIFNVFHLHIEPVQSGFQPSGIASSVEPSSRLSSSTTNGKKKSSPSEGKLSNSPDWNWLRNYCLATRVTKSLSKREPFTETQLEALFSCTRPLSSSRRSQLRRGGKEKKLKSSSMTLELTSSRESIFSVESSSWNENEDDPQEQYPLQNLFPLEEDDEESLKSEKLEEPSGSLLKRSHSQRIKRAYEEINGISWTMVMDTELIRWKSERPQDWRRPVDAFLFGSSAYGQLSFEDDIVQTPSWSTTFSAHSPWKLAGGERCSFILTEEGSVFACGKGDYMRLGLGSTEDSQIPKQISSLQGVCIRHISVSKGSYGHSLAIDQHGNLWSWGDGDYGKLGQGNSDQQKIPRLVEELRGKHVVQIASGFSHSACITLDGELYTWGEYSYTGHGASENVLVPTLLTIPLKDLPRSSSFQQDQNQDQDQDDQDDDSASFGVKFGKVSCGNGFTLVSSQDGMYVWSWGDGNFGRLGLGEETSQKKPHRIHTLDRIGIEKLETGALFGLALTLDGRVYSWGQGARGCLGLGDNNSRLVPTLIHTLAELGPVIDLACGINHVIAVVRPIIQQIPPESDSTLSPSSSPFDNTDQSSSPNYSTGTEVYSWGSSEHGQLGLASCVESNLPRRIEGLRGKGIHQVACGDNHSLVWTRRKRYPRPFCPSEVPQDYPNLQSIPLITLYNRLVLLRRFSDLIYETLPFFNIRVVGIGNQTTHSTESSSLCYGLDHVRALLHSSGKIALLRSWITQTASSRDIGPTIILNRYHAKKGKALFVQAAQQLLNQDIQSLRAANRAWKVQFTGEGADDVGGPYNESISEMCSELQNGRAPLFSLSPNGINRAGDHQDRYVLRAAESKSMLKLYRFLGILFGVAVRTKNPLVLHLAPIFWKRLLRMSITLGDLELVDQSFVRTHQFLLEIDQYVDEENFALLPLEAFQPLKLPSGQTLSLSYQNRKEYAHKAFELKMYECEPEFQAIRAGMALMLPMSMFSLFTPVEMEELVCGAPVIDWKVLKSRTLYKGNFVPTSDQCVWLWDVLEDMNPEDRSLFLRFVWGHSRLPTDPSDLRQPFIVQNANKSPPDQFLPTSQTCFFKLVLPHYTSKEVLAQKLTYAIRFCKTIDTDDYARRDVDQADNSDDEMN